MGNVPNYTRCELEAMADKKREKDLAKLKAEMKADKERERKLAKERCKQKKSTRDRVNHRSY